MIVSAVPGVAAAGIAYAEMSSRMNLLDAQFTAIVSSQRSISSTVSSLTTTVSTLSSSASCLNSKVIWFCWMKKLFKVVTFVFHSIGERNHYCCKNWSNWSKSNCGWNNNSQFCNHRSNNCRSRWSYAYNEQGFHFKHGKCYWSFMHMKKKYSRKLKTDEFVQRILNQLFFTMLIFILREFLNGWLTILLTLTSHILYLTSNMV